MKQYITKIQWDELDADKKMTLVGAMGWDSYDETSYTYWEFVNIGQLIEFLGTDLNVMEFIGKWSVVVCDDQGYLKEELIDALWMATKHKLKL